MHTLIERWRSSGTVAIAISLHDFEAVEQLTASSSQVKLLGNILGLLYLDPLGAGPGGGGLKSYRDLTERMMYAAVPCRGCWAGRSICRCVMP
jgi:hypothetical protein